MGRTFGEARATSKAHEAFGEVSGEICCACRHLLHILERALDLVGAGMRDELSNDGRDEANVRDAVRLDSAQRRSETPFSLKYKCLGGHEGAKTVHVQAKCVVDRQEGEKNRQALGSVVNHGGFDGGGGSRHNCYLP